MNVMESPVVNGKDLLDFCGSDTPGEVTPVTAGSRSLPSRLNSHASLPQPPPQDHECQASALCVSALSSYGGASEAQTAITPQQDHASL